ncbi:protein MON2 [Chaetomidium leptoderma]|uniref:Protein MON2 n=1 Tax=Chaetomidium leptoderma TaxID=669021 RepID=A0AAN6VHH5_9PEZI|nr:protein MON2 [Chaetomidium leptoderma]
MTAQLLASELANLIQESKRKHSDLRQAAEKSLDELKTLRTPSEAQTSEAQTPDTVPDLAQRPNFVNPFIIACGTKNVKFTGIAIVCLQRLIVSRALPRSRLSQVLDALQQATSAGLDVQLKILQALPALLSNYSADVKGQLLVTALNVCFILQSSKNAIVNNTSAATLQQLVVSVFDKVVAEDKSGGDSPTVGEVPVGDSTVPLRAAAMDAHRVFNDICLLTEGQRPEYLRVSGLPQTFGLELIESVLTNHAGIFTTHTEQASILRMRVMPFIISALRGRPNFATSVRLVRILYTLLRRHLSILPSESRDALEILTRLLDQDTSLWKRALCMEVFRGIFSEHALLRRIFMLYDAQEGQKNILKNLTATFVRVSTERPVVIGLGHQSTIPVASASIGASNDQVMLEASGVTGILASSVGSDGHNTGISSQWSVMRVPCIDQLDKTDAPAIPESYVYSLTLSCITSLSEGLAKFILPLTVPSEGRRKRGPKQDAGRDSPAPQVDDSSEKLERSASFKRNPVPVNPLTLESHPLYAEIKVCAAFIDECWPAILATCSTFLYAALDSEYYHSLVRAFQKFAHVAGLLQLATPRDAFLTTLGKAAVPPNVFTACTNYGPVRPPPSPVATEGSGNIFSNARGLLSVDSLVSPSIIGAEKQRQHSMDLSSITLNTRNLLCLRALLNLGIALGPTLSSSWSIVLETLQQADFVMFSSGKAAGRTPLAAKGPDPQAEQEASALLANFNTETRAVETAASRLFESTVDFPNPAFVEIVGAVCNLLEHAEPPSGASSRPQSPPSTAGLRTPSLAPKRVISISAPALAGPNQENQFALSKLGDIASINIERLLAYPPDVSGWTPLTTELINALSSVSNTASVRARAAETLVRILLEEANAVAPQPEGVRGQIQKRLLEAFRDSLVPMQTSDRAVSIAKHAIDVDIHKIVLEGLKSLLENCGESLISGWELTFEIIDTIFIERNLRVEVQQGSPTQRTDILTRAVKLIRPSFASLQLICSDFLPSLPNACFLNLVDTLYKFCTQDDELNVALTTVTFFWAISDFLSAKSETMSITEDMILESEDQALIALAAEPFEKGSGAALWMLLLLRLTSVAADQRLELRNSAIQTLMRIISAYGESLSPEAWSVCMRAVVFTLLSSVEGELRAVDKPSMKDKNKNQDEWKETAIVVLQGVSDLFGSYLGVLAAHRSFSEIWRDLMGHFRTLLDLQILDINAATYSALRDILRRCAEQENPSVGKDSMDLAWELWSHSVPIPRDEKDDKSSDNQKCLVVWVEALLELYGLIHADFSVERVRRMLTLLHEAMQHATPGAYASDIEYVTPLQGKILEVFRMVRTDLEGVPSAMITQVAEFVSLAFAHEGATKGATERRTYVAMSKESMSILQSLVVKNASERDIYETGAFATALSALAKPVTLKYQFKIVTKSVQPWRVATQSALAVLTAALPHLRTMELPREAIQNSWQIIISIANGIISADLAAAAAAAADIMGDQEFDMASFRELRQLIIPALGAEVVLDESRKSYAEGLFRTSIMHAPAPAEAAVIYGNTSGRDATGLSALYKKRNGRTIDVPPTKRSLMSEVCLDELFSLVEARDEEEEEETPTTYVDTGRLHIRLARTVAPYLILRCALTLRGYVADQPLRGRMPQPLSQRKELRCILRRLVALRSEPDAIPDAPNVESETRKHLLRLYPLLVNAVQVAGTAGDEKVLGLIREALDVVGGEFGL